MRRICVVNGRFLENLPATRERSIVTIMAGDPPENAISDYAQSLHSRWELVRNATAERRAEDIAACQILGADHLHWNVPDCIYRLDAVTGSSFYVSDDDIFGNVHPAEANLINSIAEKLRALPAAEQVFAPLTVGNHVDHQLVRTAAELAFGSELHYYEDYPYAQNEGALESVLPANRVGWLSEVVVLEETAVLAKFNAISAFVSQVSTFFSDRADLEYQVRNYINQVGGERIWQQSQT
ncbi:MAG: PIG-L family deacetylase [Chloroflexota bacterium]